MLSASAPIADMKSSGSKPPLKRMTDDADPSPPEKKGKMSSELESTAPKEADTDASNL